VITALTQLWLVCAGFIYYWTRIQVDPTPRGDHHLVSLWISITEGIFDGVLGLVVAFGPLIAPQHYLELHRSWGPSVRFDQMIGGGVLWVVGDILALPFVGTLVVRWRRDDAEQAEQIDQKLDQQEIEGEVTGNGLWWETDPVFADRFRRQ
jgi:cytochrome c oxidase assembly factor CtaG